MLIYNLRLNDEKENVTISVSIESKTLGEKELWFSTEQKYKNAICSGQYDAFLVGLLYPAMKYGEDIHIAGSVSKKLLFNINNYVIPLVKSYSPSCKTIKVTAEGVVNNNFKGGGVGTGFSGGVDSFCTIYDHYNLEEDPEYKINAFIFLNVGSHGLDEEKAEQKFHKRYEYLRKFPDEIGINFIPLNSNLHLFHPWGHQKTHTLTSASGVLILQGLFNRYYYASSGLNYDDMLENAYKYKEFSIGEYCDPILLPLLGTESLEFVSDGVQYTRTDKTLRISDYEYTKKYLNVCIMDSLNCGKCHKCIRTLTTLDALGKISDYNNVFDLDKYFKKRDQYIGYIIANKNKVFFDKIYAYFKNKKMIKLSSRLYGICFSIVNILKKIVKRIIKIFIKY